ncbi:MAG: PhzF family phenazine biosynthesis protein [Bacteroidetes bacterium]|nr:PhzF family phenazine biosynthesis protein [Bacteroidota bacterium]
MRLFLVDAFADRPFVGNPAAVAIADMPLPEPTMQAMAMEMNQAETAFPQPRADGDGYYLRWFTPLAEVALCGHATLATAHVLWTEGFSDAPALRFHTRSGVLACERLADGRIAMDFPATPPTVCPPLDGLTEALGATPVWTGRSRFDVFVRLESAEAVRNLTPNLSALARLDARGVIVTAPGDEGFDCVSRFFAPQVGVPEDPVTGSAHCAIAPYWATETGHTTLRAYQASPRGGELELEMRGDRVVLRGRAVTVVRGTAAAADLTSRAGG